MSYPNAYCVKCGKQTESLHKHTVVMQNGSRAVKGVCSSCTSEVYKILPKKREIQEKAGKAEYPDAFCLKCRCHTSTENARTVVLDNNSRAVTGSCAQCGSEVYRILPPRRDPANAATLRLVPRSQEGKTTLKIAPAGLASSQALLAQAERQAKPANDGNLRLQTRRQSESFGRGASGKSLWLGGLLIGLIVAAFLGVILIG